MRQFPLVWPRETYLPYGQQQRRQSIKVKCVQVDLRPLPDQKAEHFRVPPRHQAVGQGLLVGLVLLGDEVHVHAAVLVGEKSPQQR